MGSGFPHHGCPAIYIVYQLHHLSYCIVIFKNWVYVLFPNSRCSENSLGLEMR